MGEPGWYRIDDVAERTGLTKRTIRYWEEIGLLEPPSRTDGGYRLFTDDDLARMQRIKQFKRLLGFSLAEIKRLVEADEQRGRLRAGIAPGTDGAQRAATLAQMATLTTQQIEQIDDKVRQLLEMRAEYQRRYERITARLRDATADAGREDRPADAQPASR